MINITCFVGLFNARTTAPGLSLSGRDISDFFREGSRGEINLQMDQSRLRRDLMADNEPANALNLHWRLQDLTKNKANVKRVNNIGLIIANTFASNSGVLGCMFDLGFNTSDVGEVSEIFTGVPREGCAIFVDAIRAIRSKASEFNREIAFTAIHELGHVFNLWHIEDQNNFMATSPLDQVLGSGAYQFYSPDHSSFLAKAPSSSFVWPGGTRFGDRGPEGPASGNSFNEIQYGESLKLRIELRQKEFWYFEPVELDIKLSLARGNARKRAIPDEIDPGYDRFKIKIGRPDGTSFFYKASRIFCSNTNVIEITKEKPFLRDVSIFGQSGGYTFAGPGEYTVQAFLRLEKGQTLVSNKVICMVKKNKSINDLKFHRQKKLLTNSEVGLLLYHRSGRFKRSLLEELNYFSTVEKSSVIGQNVNYALARWLYQNATLRSKEVRKKRFALVSGLAKKALDSALMSESRIKNLELILNSIGT